MAGEMMADLVSQDARAWPIADEGLREIVDPDGIVEDDPDLLSGDLLDQRFRIGNIGSRANVEVHRQPDLLMIVCTI